MYEGPIKDVSSYITGIGYCIGEAHKYNPVEFFVELLSNVEETNKLKSIWLKEHPIDPTVVSLGAQDDCPQVPVVAHREGLSLWKQTWILTQRHALYTL